MTSASAIQEYAAARFGLEGRCVLVTGGTKGIGKAVVEEFCSLGADVYTCARNQEDVESALKAWQSKGLKVRGHACDVSKEEDCQELFKKVQEAFGGKLHVLVNNVGTNIRSPTVQYTEQDFQTMFDTNLRSAWRLSQLCHPLLKASLDGCILFNSSVAGGPTCMRSGTLYAMTKAAMNQLARNLAVEWAPDHIRVLAVAPWYTLTELAQAVLKDKEYEAGVLARTPMGRVARPDEVSGLMAFLCSPAASYMTGQTVAVDGGYSVKGFW